MAKKETGFRKIKTIEGITMHLYEDRAGLYKPHCATGPAIIYPDSDKRTSEYYFYGVKYDHNKWYELTKSYRTPEPKEDLDD